MGEFGRGGVWTWSSLDVGDSVTRELGVTVLSHGLTVLNLPHPR